MLSKQAGSNSPGLYVVHVEPMEEIVSPIK
jgi:hypothetical protein